MVVADDGFSGRNGVKFSAILFLSTSIYYTLNYCSPRRRRRRRRSKQQSEDEQDDDILHDIEYLPIEQSDDHYPLLFRKIHMKRHCDTRVVRRHYNSKCERQEEEEEDSSSGSDTDDDEDDDLVHQRDYFGCGGSASGRVSSRGLLALMPVQSYLKSFFQCLMDPCDAEINPNGHVALCVAENKLVQEMLANRLMSFYDIMEDEGLDVMAASALSNNGRGMEVPHEDAGGGFMHQHTQPSSSQASSTKKSPYSYPNNTPPASTCFNTVVAAFSDQAAYSYNGFLGLPSAREAVAGFLSKYFLRCHTDDDPTCEARSNEFDYDMDSTVRIRNNIISSSQQGDSPSPTNVVVEDEREKQNNTSTFVDPAHIALGSGAGSLLHYLCFLLCDPGDVILIPAPYYAAFENYVHVMAQCIPFPVECRNPVSGPTINDLDIAYRKAQRMLAQQSTMPLRRSGKVKAILLTNPNNPLGICYRPSILRDVVEWSRSKGLHTIVDEIYALSQHHEHTSFQSIIRVLRNQLGYDVHMLWGLSKDFGAAGFRVGVLYTQNNLLLHSLANLNIFSGVPHPMQLIVADLLSDYDFIDLFLRHARQCLLQSYRLCVRKLDEMVVPYIPAEAGTFVYADFSSILPSPTRHGEVQFAKWVQTYAKVVLTPGQSQRDRKPGMFRICYAWVSPDVLEIAMERLSLMIVRLRRARGGTIRDIEDTLNETFSFLNQDNTMSSGSERDASVRMVRNSSRIATSSSDFYAP